jgi:FdhD protein
MVKIQGTSFEEREDYIAVEKKLRVSLNRREIVTLYCTPSMIKELVVGLLMTEGILQRKISPDEIQVKEDGEISVNIHTADAIPTELTLSRCLGGFTFSREKNFEKVKDGFSLSPQDMRNIFQEFQQKSELFKLTGCFHSAALSDRGNILAFAEDIGRHNAVDKVVGYAILSDISFAGKLMLVSCRISSEIVAKCARWSIPLIASRGAATELAVEIAEASGITLLGFVRGDRLNVYTNTHRIKLKQ